jgi:predicted O-linked N-acetylglucosamine transferase (SPINDLY family)
MSNRRARFRDASVKKPRTANDTGSAFARALALHQNGLLADAQTLYREILRNLPNHFDALHLLGVSEHQSGHLDAAESLIRRALVIDPRSAAAHSNLGNLLVQSRRLGEALASFEKAIALKADYSEAFFNKAHALGELRRFEEAVASYDRAIVLKPDFAEAWSNRGHALLELQRPAEALQSCDRAITLRPGFAEAWGHRGNILRALKRPAEVLESFDRALALRPNSAEAWNNRGNALRELRRLDEALASYDRANALAPDFAAAYRNRGITLLQLGRPDAALECVDRSISLDPTCAAGFFSRGNAMLYLERREEALISYDRAVELDPSDAPAFSNRGNVLRELKRFDDGLVACDAAIALDPQYVEAYNNRGNILRELNRFDEAVASYDVALSVKPDYAGVWCNRGEALFSLERFDAAIASHDRALAIDPNLAAAWLGRANILIRTNRLIDAFAACNNAVSIAPNSPRALTQLGQCHARQGDTVQAVACYDRVLAIKPDYESAISNKVFTLDFDGNVGFAEHQAARAYWWQQIGSKIAARSQPHHDNDCDPSRRIVLGYVSSDFRRHSAAIGFSPVLESHDKTQFEVICYSCSLTEDAGTREFQQMADRWRNASQWSDDYLADRIRADKVDILIDLSGHSAGHRLRVFARKPAPIQVTAWGHSTGTGLSTIDYLFSDPVAIPSAVRHLFAERIYDLPCLVIIEPPLSEMRCTEPPVLSKGHITYGVFNRIDKISDDAVRVWARILQSDVAARLLIKHHAVDDSSIRSTLRERFARHGLSADRIDLLGSTSREQHLAAYGQVDVCLDPFPQTGGVSTWEALHMGVPVVAKLGGGVSNRLSGAILSAIGMTEWVAADDDEYAGIALNHASVPDRLRTIRHELPARIAVSSEWGPAAYTRAVEEAYRAMWKEYCDRAT